MSLFNKNIIYNQHETFSVKKFWKLKNCITCKGDNRTSIISSQGVELFDDDPIVNEYVNEFKERLSHREIHPSLQNYQEITHKLVDEYMIQAKRKITQDFTPTEVYLAIHELKNGKSPDPDFFPPDIFKYAGTHLILVITNTLNNIKKNLIIPTSWIRVIVVTIYKNKGSKKRLKNHRGIFLAAILFKINEKLIKNRAECYFENINSCQLGATKNRSTGDCVFIIRSLIDHALYLNTPLYLTLYDYSTCFDSLWLEDTMIALWNIGIRDQLFPLIYKMNEQTLVSIRTPYGPSPEFSCPTIVKQGCVLSTKLCGSATGQLFTALDTTDDCGATVGSALVKGVMFVDDTTTVNKNPVGATKSNRTVATFSQQRRLQLNIPKCVQLPVNLKRSEVAPCLMIGDEEISNVCTAKCVGDVFASNGANNDLVADRTKKGKAIIASTLSLCNDITLGQHYVKSAITLYQFVFLSILFNSQAWSNITQTQMKDLQTVQLKFLKRIMQAPASTCNIFVFLELAILPIEFEFHKRQLVFLHHIVHMDRNEPVPQLYHQQILFTHENNWGNNMKILLSKYQLQDTDVKTLTKDEWKLLVDSRVTDIAFKSLRTQCLTQTKISGLNYLEFKPQPYLLKSPSDVASFVFRFRARNLNCKNNHHKSFPNITCRLCHVEIEDQNHVINCSNLFSSTLNTDHLLATDLELNISFVRQMMDRYKKFHEK